MAIELVTGRAGTPHVDSSDMRALYAEIVGRVRYLLNDYEMGVAEMESANDCHLMPAELLVDGAHVRITGDGETVHIDNGSSSYDRVDVVALHYTSTGSPGSRVESISVEVVKGTPVDTGGEAQDPAMPSGSATILDGSTDVYIPYVRVKLVGLAPQAPELMVKKINYNMSTVGVQLDLHDSLITSLEGKVGPLSSKAPYVRSKSSSARLTTGTSVVTFVQGWCTLLNDARIRSLIGRSFDQARDCIAVMNGDKDVQEDAVVSAVFNATSKEINLRAVKVIPTGVTAVSGPMRINYILASG